jgi:polysaccharide pyruvyl transferase WcaK-like protein
MYIVLSGAKKNAGDFLITERSEALLKALRPDRPLRRLPGWESLEPHLEEVNGSKAIIILGGPGLQQDLYPKVYKLTSDLSRIRVPIILMGSGWKAFPGDLTTLKQFAFSPQSLQALRKMSASATFLSCRDVLSVRVLRAAGISNALMTGCPVWYDMPQLGKPMRLPSEVNHVIFTPAQLSFYREPSLAVAKQIRRVFPKARLVCSFHRGIAQPDKFLSEEERHNNSAIARAAESMGYEVVDVSGSANADEEYGKCDVHVGFRLHAHLCSLSKRVPSVLLHEDGRGVGASQTLNVRGFDAFHRSITGSVPSLPPRVSRFLDRRLGGIVPSADCGAEVGEYLVHLQQTGFAAYAGVGDVIDAHFEQMKRFLNSLP